MGQRAAVWRPTGAPADAASRRPHPRSTRAQDTDAHLQHHFDSIQGIADGTTIPSLLPALWRALALAADVEAPLERLRAAREAPPGTGGLGTTDKVALWQVRPGVEGLQGRLLGWREGCSWLWVCVQARGALGSGGEVAPRTAGVVACLSRAAQLPACAGLRWMFTHDGSDACSCLGLGR